MAQVTEVAPDVYRISVFVREFNLGFNHFLVKDDEPLLFHAGLRSMFPELRDALATVMDPARLRWIAFSHFESDECGGLNHWLEAAPAAQPVCNLVAALVSVNDFSNRPARVIPDEERLVTGRRSLRFLRTPHLPHGWDAGVVYDETGGTLFCSDLFHQVGDCEPVTTSDILGRVRDTLVEYQGGPFANYVPYTAATGRMLNLLADLKPRTLAVMHGSSYSGNCEQAIRSLAGIMRDVLG